MLFPLSALFHLGQLPQKFPFLIETPSPPVLAILLPFPLFQSQGFSGGLSSSSLPDKERRERKRKLNKELAEKATRELEKMQLKEKADIKYKEWLEKKRAEEAEKKKKEKEKEKERVAELQEKRTRSEKIFKEWLQNARNKPRPALNGYGFPNGKSTGSAVRNLYPAPAYCNPIPWKPVHVSPPKEDTVVSRKRSQRPGPCQPFPSGDF
ncbi:coiled-coil domain-containing protein 34-like [Agelaius tricolor]|uniref:coiled-coil domain-containing protein 34-like n=1 Tax=Agelaius tricolor TaxID=9191 RepID=UPI0039F1AAE0